MVGRGPELVGISDIRINSVRKSKVLLCMINLRVKT